jgi:hypothetical protein
MSYGAHWNTSFAGAFDAGTNSSIISPAFPCRIIDNNGSSYTGDTTGASLFCNTEAGPVYNSTNLEFLHIDSDKSVVWVPFQSAAAFIAGAAVVGGNVNDVPAAVCRVEYPAPGKGYRAGMYWSNVFLSPAPCTIMVGSYALFMHPSQVLFVAYPTPPPYEGLSPAALGGVVTAAFIALIFAYIVFILKARATPRTAAAVSAASVQPETMTFARLTGASGSQDLSGSAAAANYDANQAQEYSMTTDRRHVPEAWPAH